MTNSTWRRIGAAVVLVPAWCAAQTFSINTFAGGGPNHVAAAITPIGFTENVVTDTSGNVYFSTSTWHRVYKVNTSNVMILVAGYGIADVSGDGGLAINAGLNTPKGLAIDSQNNLYIADSANNKVRKVSLTTGIITTFAGNGVAGSTGDGGAATSASLRTPVGVAVDGGGNVYISDQGNFKIRKVDGTGMIATFAGTGLQGFAGDGSSAAGAQFNTASGIAFDALGNNLIVADTLNNRIRRIGLTGANIIQTIVNQAPGTAGFSGDGTSAFNAQVNNPTDVFVDGSGNLYICDKLNFRIRKVPLTNGNPGNISTIAGSANGTGNPLGDGGPATSGSLNNPTGVTFGTNGSLYIADRVDNRVRVVTNSTINTLAGNGGSVTLYGGDGANAVDALINQPFGESVDSQGNVYVCDWGNNRVRKIDTNGVMTTIAGTGVAGSAGDGGAATSAQLFGPAGSAIDSQGNIYIAEFNGHRIRVIRNGIISTYAGNGLGGYSGDGAAAALAKVNFPIGLAVDGANNLYIADSGNNVVRKVDFNSQIITTVVGNFANGAGYGGDNGPPTGPLVKLNRPTQVAVNNAGTVIYVSDENNNRIRWVSNSVLNTFAGTGTAGYGGDGLPANQALLNSPAGVTLDQPNNRLYILDFSNNRVRLVAADSPNNIINTVAGSSARGFGGDGGAATSALLANPFSVTIDAGGKVYVGDQSNNRVRVLTQACTFTFGGIANPLTVAAAGGTGFTVTVTTQPGCIWTTSIISNPGNFIAVQTAASQNGSGGVIFNVLANAGSARSGSLSIAGVTYTVNQLGVSGGNGADKVGIFNSTQAVFLLDANGNFAWDGASIDKFFSWGAANHNPRYKVVLGDWNGGGTKKVGIYDSATATWLLDYNGDGIYTPGVDKYFSWGSPGDIPVVGDWNGTGTTKVGTFNPSNGYWILDFNGNFLWDGAGTDKFFPWGSPGDTPVVGDWNGTRTTKVGTFGPGTGLWLLDYNGNFAWDGAGVDKYFAWGSPGDTPLVGDWNGSGSTKIGTFGPGTGLWLLDYNGNFAWDGPGVDRYFPWGSPGDTPVVGDWNGTGTTKVGTFGPGTGLWLLDYNGNFTWDGASVDKYLAWGSPGDTPIVGKW